MSGDTAVAPAQPEDPELNIGELIAFQPSAHQKDKLDPLDIHIGGRRCNVVGCRRRNSHAPRMISKEFTMVQRSESHFDDVDGVCQ